MTQPTNDCSVQNYRFLSLKGGWYPFGNTMKLSRKHGNYTIYIYISRYYMYVCMMQVYINVIQVDMYVCGDWWLHPL